MGSHLRKVYNNFIQAQSHKRTRETAVDHRDVYKCKFNGWSLW